MLSDGVQNSDNVFLVDEGGEDSNVAKSMPSSGSQRNAIVMASRWRADHGQTLNAGYVAL